MLWVEWSITFAASVQPLVKWNMHATRARVRAEHHTVGLYSDKMLPSKMWLLC